MYIYRIVTHLFGPTTNKKRKGKKKKIQSPLLISSSSKTTHVKLTKMYRRELRKMMWSVPKPL